MTTRNPRLSSVAGLSDVLSQRSVNEAELSPGVFCWGRVVTSGALGSQRTGLLLHPHQGEDPGACFGMSHWSAH